VHVGFGYWKTIKEEIELRLSAVGVHGASQFVGLVAAVARSGGEIYEGIVYGLKGGKREGVEKEELGSAIQDPYVLIVLFLCTLVPTRWTLLVYSDTLGALTRLIF
jgi:hypothetical protein